MLRIARSSFYLTILLMAGQAIGQEYTGPFPEPEMPWVTIWSQAPVMSDALADGRFTQTFRQNIRAHDWNHPAGAAGVAAGVIYDMTHGRTAYTGRVAHTLIGVSTGNIFGDADANGDRTPALFAHEADCLWPETDVEVEPLALKRTPWMSHGIAEAKTWMQTFLCEYDDAVYNNIVPAPNRFLFDDEPSNLLSENTGAGGLLNADASHMQYIVDYWNQLYDDPRFTTEAVPGFNGATLYDLWLARDSGIEAPYVPANATPPEYWNVHFPGGTEANSLWLVWFFNLMRQAEAGAMQEAFYDPIHCKYPNAKCSDYGRSLRLEFNQAEPNGFFGGDQAGADGIRYAWDGFGDLQAPCLYPQAGPYFYDTAYCDDPFGRTNDAANTLNWCPYEPIGTFSSRISRYILDSCVFANEGAHNNTLAPWVMLPGQATFLTGPNAEIDGCDPPSTETTLWGAYNAGVYHRTSFADTRMTLAQVRAHGSNEFNIWNNDTFGASEAGLSGDVLTAVQAINDNIHCETANNWDRMVKIVDQVWGFTVFSAHVSAGTTPLGTSGAIHRLACSLGDTLAVAPASSGTYRTDVQSTFYNSYSPIYGHPEYLRVNVEVASTTGATLHVKIKNFTLDQWEELDLDPTGGNTPDAADIYGGPRSPVGPGPTKRVSIHVPVTSDYFGSSNEVMIETATSDHTVTTGSQYVYYDLVQVIADDEEENSPADLNMDGIVDCTDLTLWNYIMTAATAAGAQGKIRSLADFNHDHYVDSNDTTAFGVAWSAACVLNCP